MEKPKISAKIRNIEFDEMWHFIQSKKTKNGSSKQWIVIEGELLDGLSAIVRLYDKVKHFEVMHFLYR